MPHCIVSKPKSERHFKESKYILQSPAYLITAVNRFIYINYNVSKNRSVKHLDFNIMLGPYKFNLHVTVDHAGLSIHCGHYTTSVNCCGKSIYCNDGRIADCVRYWTQCSYGIICN